MDPQPDSGSSTVEGRLISLAAASQVVDAALAHGRSEGLGPLTVAVLDAAGLLVTLKREDGSSLMRPDIAQAKAFGSLAMGMGSRGLAGRAASHPAFVTSMTMLAGGRLVPVPGGVLVKDAAGQVVGAVGVSGALPDQDEACAVAGIERAGLRAEPAGGH